MTTPPTDRVALATWPTPMESAAPAGSATGLQADGLWLKRDDLIGLRGWVVADGRVLIIAAL